MLGRRLLLIAAALAVAGGCGSNQDTGVATRAAAEVPASEVGPPADNQASPTDGDRREELLGRWDVTDYQLPDGALTRVVGATPAFIEFRADGTVAYDTGCNQGGSRFRTEGIYAVPESALADTPEGQPITIGPLFEQEQEGCEGFLGDQDRDLPANMGAATRFVLDNDRLLLLNEFLLIEAVKSE